MAWQADSARSALEIEKDRLVLMQAAVKKLESDLADLQDDGTFPAAKMENRSTALDNFVATRPEGPEPKVSQIVDLRPAAPQCSGLEIARTAAGSCLGVKNSVAAASQVRNLHHRRSGHCRSFNCVVRVGAACRHSANRD
jgi:hypothetical protein